MGQCKIIDIDAGVDAALQVAEGEQLYRLLAENSGDMIVCYGLDLVRRYVSPASEALLGYAPRELLRRSPIDDIHPDDLARIVGAVSGVQAGVTPPALNYRQRRKDGTYVWLETSYRLLRDRQTGETEQLVAVVRDISLRKAAEEAAAEAMARANESLRLLSMAERMAHVGHWRIDTRANRFFWSPEVFRIYGLEPGAPPRIRQALAAYHPDDQGMIETLMRRATETGGEFEFAARLFRPGGELRHVVSRGQAEYAADGSVAAVFGVLQDVTQQAKTEAALREGEARYRLLAENATDIIFRLDRQGRFLYVSPGIETVSGYRPEDRIGRNAFTLVHADDRGPLLAALEGLWEGRTAHGIVNYRALCADGEWRWLEASVRTVLNDGVVEIVGVTRDISARKRFEAELLSAREAAESAAREARHLAETDELTGLANRRMFMRRLDMEIDAARRTALPLSVAIFDIDHFKKVNDHYGHAVGDAVLERIAGVARAAAGPDATVGRLGGEEFAILIPGADASQAAAVGERVRAAIEADVSELPAITISIGMASFTADRVAANFLADADGALYEAKRSGRNRLCLAGAAA